MENDKDRTSVARDLVTRCRRCGLDLMHVVVVHNQEGMVERVKCKTCGSEHKYHPDKTKLPSKAVQKKRTVPKKENSAAVFEKLAEKVKGRAAIPYTISRSYQTEDVIDHKSFGIGIVTGVSHQKMDVLFSEGPRILGCNR